jgi:predicted lipoprotein with Yx(FWY)xxD motif
VAGDGRTLYMFVPDQQKNGRPTCYGECEQAWPVLEATGEVTAGDGLDQSLLDTVERRDGTLQVTYNGLPLYYFSGDEAAGDVAGQGLNDVWWVLSADGKPVRKAAGGDGGSPGYSP